MITIYIRRVVAAAAICMLAAVLSIGCSLTHSPDTPPFSGNVILVIGDGMGFAHVEAASRFFTGEDDSLSFQQFPVQNQMTTHSLSGVTDSAAAATAIATGYKVINGVISTLLCGEPETVLEYYQRFGKSTGLVTTTYITHATPAAFGAHNFSRDKVSYIAGDFLQGSRPNVLFGGGGNGMSVSAAEEAGYTVVTDRDSLFAVDASVELHISGQFGTSHLPYALDGYGILPTLPDMTQVALDILDEDPDGFFLMVEAGRIDHASHGNDLGRMVREVGSLADTIDTILAWAGSREDTIIIVTADHETGDLASGTPITEGVMPDIDDQDQYWGSEGHTGVPVPLYAWGFQAGLFSGAILDNTDIYRILVNNF